MPFLIRRHRVLEMPLFLALHLCQHVCANVHAIRCSSCCKLRLCLLACFPPRHAFLHELQLAGSKAAGGVGLEAAEVNGF